MTNKFQAARKPYIKAFVEHEKMVSWQHQKQKIDRMQAFNA